MHIAVLHCSHTPTAQVCSMQPKAPLRPVEMSPAIGSSPASCSGATWSCVQCGTAVIQVPGVRLVTLVRKAPTRQLAKLFFRARTLRFYFTCSLYPTISLAGSGSGARSYAAAMPHGQQQIWFYTRLGSGADGRAAAEQGTPGEQRRPARGQPGSCVGA